MKNVDRWQPSKVLSDPRTGRYVPNPRYVSPGSRYIVSVIAPQYERVIRAHACGRLLDCGCGDVPYYAMYRNQVDEVTCIDWSASENGRQHVDLEVDLNGALPLDKAAFNTVLLADVLEHIHGPQTLVSEIARVLAPSGKLIAMVPFFYPVHEAPHDHYRYTRFALERLCAQAGLSVLELRAYGGYPDVLCEVINKGLERMPMLCRAFVSVAGWLSRTELWKRWRARTVDRFPLGYCLVAIKELGG